MNSTQKLTEYITTNTPCIFAKYGDGEYNAANFYEGGNCDGTPYTSNLGTKVRESFVYNSQQPNAMMGAWHDSSNKVFWEGLGNPTVNWVDFHTVLIDHQTHTTDKLELFTAIKNSKLKKVYVANANMHKSVDIFKLDKHVVIDPSNWFDTQYDSVFNTITSSMEDRTLVLTSAGMGAKYLISELHKLYPNSIYIDIGSGFDKLCTGVQTRTYNPSYDSICNYLRPLLDG